MNTEQRIKMIRLIEKIDKNPEFSQKIGIRNTSAFVSDKSKKILQIAMYKKMAEGEEEC